MKKIAIFSFILLTLSLITSSSFAISPGGSCKKAGEIISQGNKKFTCMKIGKNLSWNSGTVIKSKPKTLASISDLSGSTDGKTFTFSFSKPVSINDDVTYELGFEYLMNPGNDPTLSSSYSEIDIWKTSESTKFILPIDEIKNWLPSQINASKTWIAIKVRAVSKSVNSAWSNGIYITPAQLSGSPISVPTTAASPSAASNTASTCGPYVGIGADYGLEKPNHYAYIFTNFSDCNLKYQVAIKWHCKANGQNKPAAVYLETTDILTLKPKETLYISELNSNGYFLNASSNCIKFLGNNYERAYGIQFQVGGSSGGYPKLKFIQSWG